MKISFILATLVLTLIPVAKSVAQDGSFLKLDFGSAISIEIPRNWEYKDEKIRQHLNTAGEAMARLAGITPNPGENVILVAGSAYTSSASPAATLRLSVRSGPAPTQQDTRQLASLPKKELFEALQPSILKNLQSLKTLNGVKNATPTDLGVRKNKSLSCTYDETTVEFIDGDQLVMQTYVCPLGTKMIKLSTSYRKADSALFKPVLKYVWSSLRASQ
jgi:hypothetical protein